MGMNKLGSLAAYFQSDPKAKETYRASNPTSRVKGNYLFSVNVLRDDLNCGADNDCEWFLEQAQDQPSEDLQKFIFCISCDRIYHLRCCGLDFTAIKIEHLPWICHKCSSNPLNTQAQAVVNNGKHSLSFEVRRKFFLKESQATLIEVASRPIDFPSASDQKEQDGRNEQGVPPNILELLNSMKQQLEQQAMENKCLLQRIQELETNGNINKGTEKIITTVDEANGASTSGNGSSNKCHDSNDQVPQRHCTSYTEAVLQNNSVVAGIEVKDERISALNAGLSPIMRNNMEVGSSTPQTPRAIPQIVDLTRAQKENSIPGDPMEATIRHMNMMSLNDKRKILPKIETFSGQPEKWLTFQRSVERNQKEGEYSDELMKYQIRQALAGQALTRVDALFDFMTAKQIMDFLRDSYGNSTLVVESARQKLMNVKLARPLTHVSCTEVTTLIASYIAACNYAGLMVADTTISSKIHYQLEAYHQQLYYEFYFKKFPNATTRLGRLDVQFEFLNSLSKTLPLGSFKSDENKYPKNKGNFQVMSASIKEPISAAGALDGKSYGNPTSNDNDSYKFEIRDKENAKYLGYDMNKVKAITKRCEICTKNNHFTVECSSYRNMKIDERIGTIRRKNICLNCLLTTSHSAKDCEVKNGCGFKIDRNVRCTGKHHITLHRGKWNNNNGKTGSNDNYKKQKRRAKSQQNAARANERLMELNQSQQSSGNVSSNNSQVLTQSVQSQIEQKPAVSTQASTSHSNQNHSQPLLSSINRVHNNPYHIVGTVGNINQSSQRTVKLFNILFYGNKIKAVGFAVGDSAAEITLIKKELVDDLGITGEPTILNLTWTDATVKQTPAWKVKLRISGVLPGDELYEIDECYAVPDLNLPPRSLDVTKLKQHFPHLSGVPFNSYFNAIPSMIIGSKDAYLIEAIEPVIQAGNNKPVAIKSRLGFTIYGGAPDNFQQVCTINNNMLDATGVKNEQCVDCADSEQGADSTEPVRISNEQLNELFAKSCALDSLGIKPVESHLTKEEKKAIQIIEEEMKILDDGTVELPLIWNKINDEIPKLPNNYAMVYQRQVAQENKLRKTPELLSAFNNNFLELIKENYVRRATERDLSTKWPNVWYIPMSLVVNANKQPIKTRNVYDASAKYKGTSLNDHLLMGPNLLVDMLNPLMRMRLFKYAFTGDVKSMFHRIRICERDQQAQRILWRQTQEEPMQEYVAQVVLFGPKSSPYSSQIVKNKTAEKYESIYPSAARALKDFTYMDDLLTSEPTIHQAIETATQCIEILKSINWELLGFTSNSLEILRALNPHNVKQDAIEIMTTEESAYTTKVLGVAWNPKIDAFIFQLSKNTFFKLVKEYGHKPTKRDQCSTIARIFDVMGFISHAIIRGRILLQRSWIKKIDWDEEITDEDHVEWIKWITDLEKVSMLKIPRLRFSIYNISDAQTLELHCFCDAGKEAFAAVAYFVATINGSRYVSFIMSKAKVTPIKIQSKSSISEIPRLEMLSSLIAARLTNTIMNQHKDFKFETYFWSDSEIVLNWIQNEHIKLPRYAWSPVAEILELTNPQQWNFIDSKNNVADYATKFKKCDFGDYDSPWFQGPEFLKKPKEYWPQYKPRITIAALFVGIVNQETKTFTSAIKLPPIDCPLASDYIIDLLSPSIINCWPKLVRAIARALKFYDGAIIPMAVEKIHEIRKAEKATKTSDENDPVPINLKFLYDKMARKKDFVNLEPIDIERAELFIIRSMQREIYTHEYKRLTENKRLNNIELLQLNVFMDKNGIMRISSRVGLSKVYAANFSPLVPRKSSLSNALLFDYHYQYNHVGFEAQIAEFRSKFWMPKLRQALQEIASKCNYCRYMRANPVEYKMADLPDFRVDINLKPFEVTGLDCAGPFTVYAKNGHQKKVWILIFTCTVTRFIKNYVIDDLTSTTVLKMIKDLWVSHGPVSRFISDNGTNFVGASNIIKNDAQIILESLKKANHELSQTLAQRPHNVKWMFIPVKSPWFGSFYERLIQTVKRSIASAVTGRRVYRTEFEIAVYEATHRINCRPLTHNPISAEDEEVLTPHHLAKYRSGWPVLPSIHGIKSYPDPLGDKSYYRRGLILAEEMGRKFVKNYLPVLTKRTKWFKNHAPLRNGDLVLMVDPNLTRKEWGRARVQRIYTSKDNGARVVDLLLPDGTIRKRRSVKHLAKLEIQTL